MKAYVLSTLLFIAFTQGKAQQNADDILGVWWNPEKTTRIEVYKENGQYFGRVTWLKEDVNPDGSSPRMDLNNENTDLRNRRVMGLIVLQNLTWDDGEYEEGTLYDSHQGRSYSCYIELENKNTLSMYVYVLGMPFLNKKMTCERYLDTGS